MRRNDVAVSIRAARPGDEEVMYALLGELAEYEKLMPIFRITPETIRRDFFSAAPRCHCELAYDGDKAVGIANWYFSYATFATRRKIYLADLFVQPSARGTGLGKALLAHLARRALEEGAVEEGAVEVEWEVLDWNKPSIDFYERIGARAASEWLLYRLGGEALDRLAQTNL
jgi:GNAT superfamily N-acetyltransferase